MLNFCTFILGPKVCKRVNKRNQVRPMQYKKIRRSQMEYVSPVGEINAAIDDNSDDEHQELTTGFSRNGQYHSHGVSTLIVAAEESPPSGESMLKF